MVLLERLVNGKNGLFIWKIVDAQVLPHHALAGDPQRPDTLALYFNGECELDGGTDTLFLALVRFGQRKRVDGHTGVEQPWGFNLSARRIVPLPMQRIVCHRMPPEE